MRASSGAQVKDRGSFYEATSFQPIDKQYTGICLSSHFQFLFAKFVCTDVQYRRPPSSLHTAPQKSCCTLCTHKSKMEGEASQTTAKSKWSQFNKEIGNTACLKVAFCLCSATFVCRQYFHNFYCKQLCVEIVQTFIKSMSFWLRTVQSLNLYVVLRAIVSFSAVLLCTTELRSS